MTVYTSYIYLCSELITNTFTYRWTLVLRFDTFFYPLTEPFNFWPYRTLYNLRVCECSKQRLRSSDLDVSSQPNMIYGRIFKESKERLVASWWWWYLEYVFCRLECAMSKQRVTCTASTLLPNYDCSKVHSTHTPYTQFSIAC